MTLLRFAFGLALILLLGVAAVATLPAAEGPLKAGGLPWGLLGAADLAYRSPGPLWKVYDPFTTQTPIAGHGWLDEVPPRSCRAALFQSPTGWFEVLLVRGRADALAPLLARGRARFDEQREVEVLPEREHVTRNGLRLRYQEAHLRTALLDGMDRSYLIGQVPLGDEWLVVSAGGIASAFAPQTVFDLLAGLELSP